MEAEIIQVKRIENVVLIEIRKEESGLWIYKYINKMKWNPDEEIEEYERNGIIRSRTGLDFLILH